MLRRVLILPLALLLAATLTACSRQVVDNRPIVVTSIAPIADMVQSIAGPDVRVVNVIPSGASPHDFEPTPQDASLISRASLAFVVGNGFDDWMLPFVSDKKTIVLSSGIADIPADPEEVSATVKFNPHIWLSPKRGMRMVDTILAGLKGISQADLDQRAADYRSQIAQEDSDYSQSFKVLTHKSIIGVHDAWPYLAADYGLTIAASIEPIAGREPTPKEVSNLAKIVHEQSITTIFSEPQLSTDLVKSLASDLGLRIAMLNPEGSADQPTYLGMLQFNRQAIVEGLK